MNYIRIWHDNSGKNGKASWFLKYIIVHNLQTREKSYFILNDWLAVEKSNGSIDKLVYISCEKQKTELKYLLRKETREKFRDEHLWYSILARPVNSAFTCTDRLTCCFVLLFITMLMNIVYYGSTGSNSLGDALKFGPFYITFEQVLHF